MRTLWQVLAIGCGIYLTIFCAPIAQAENATDKAIRAALNRHVKIDYHTVGLQRCVRQLGDAIDIPVEIDQRSTLIEGLTLGNGTRIQSGMRSAKELFELVLSQHGNNGLSFIVLEDLERRSPLAIKIVIVSHALIEKHGWIVPPSDDEEAAKIVAERLSKRLNIDVESDAPAAHWQRLSQLIEMPIDVDQELQSQLSDESTKPFKLSVGERTAQEILDWTLVQATGRTALSYMIAEDPQRRFPHQIRLVIAKRTTIATNPARFSIPRRRQNAKPRHYNVLNELITVQATDLPLREALNLIARQRPVVVLFDERALKQAGVAMDQRVSINVENQPLDRTVKLALDQLGGPDKPVVFVLLSRPTKPDELLVTTRKAAEKNQFGLSRIYLERVETD